jgi:hypothetical protein
LDLKVDAVRAKQTRYLPTVLTKEEVLAIIQQLSGVYQLVIKLLYGTGLSMIYTHVLTRCQKSSRSMKNCTYLTLELRSLLFNLSRIIIMSKAIIEKI